jgi:hypothetical protein
VRGILLLGCSTPCVRRDHGRQQDRRHDALGNVAVRRRGDPKDDPDNQTCGLT